jgi:hypothetical protein
VKKPSVVAVAIPAGPPVEVSDSELAMPISAEPVTVTSAAATPAVATRAVVAKRTFFMVFPSYFMVKVHLKTGNPN